MTARSRALQVLDVTASLLMLVTAAVLLWQSLVRPAVLQARQSPALPIQPIALDQAIVQGLASAPVTIIEFADFECPYCQRFHREVYPRIANELIKAGMARMAFLNLPLDDLHPKARASANVSACAAKQNRFWPFHDAVLGSPVPLSDEVIEQAAVSAGLSRGDVITCLAGAPARLPEEALGRTLRIASTPAFLIGATLPDQSVRVKKVITGFISYERLQSTVAAVASGQHEDACGVWSRFIERCRSIR